MTVELAVETPNASRGLAFVHSVDCRQHFKERGVKTVDGGNDLGLGKHGGMGLPYSGIPWWESTMCSSSMTVSGSVPSSLPARPMSMAPPTMCPTSPPTGVYSEASPVSAKLISLSLNRSWTIIPAYTRSFSQKRINRADRLAHTEHGEGVKRRPPRMAWCILSAAEQISSLSPQSSSSLFTSSLSPSSEKPSTVAFISASISFGSSFVAATSCDISTSSSGAVWRIRSILNWLAFFHLSICP